jgi:hypothetical protein
MMALLALILFVIGNIFMFASFANEFSIGANFVLFFLGIIQVGFSFLLIKKSIKNDFEYIEKRNESKKNKIKKSRIKIYVDLGSCEIISSNYNKTQNSFKSRQFYLFNSFYNINNEESKINVSTCKLKYRSKDIYKDKVFVSEDICLDLYTLKLKMFLSKGTVIYLNELDIEDYYFDVDFTKK